MPIFLDPVTPEHRRHTRARRQRRVLLALIVALTAVALTGAVDPAVAEIARAAAAIGASLVLVILAIVLLIASGGGRRPQGDGDGAAPRSPDGPHRRRRSRVNATRSQEDEMGLFKKKVSAEEDVVRCPTCRERVPDGALECAMCGRDLTDMLSAEQGSSTSDAGGAAHTP